LKHVAVLASGRGSNLAALLAAEDRYRSYRIAEVVSNVEGAGALEIARAAGRRAHVLPSRGKRREDHEREILGGLDPAVEVLCLAGYMRLLTPGFVAAFGRPILNIHPSLLPAFPGLRPQKQAIDSGVRWSGTTVHFVDDGLDSGPILLQEVVPVHPEDTEEQLSARILDAEHALYPRALDVVARGAFQIVGRKILLVGSTTGTT
jgi:phosphoribosylglycinamide formyltransferase 1